VLVFIHLSLITIGIPNGWKRVAVIIEVHCPALQSEHFYLVSPNTFLVRRGLLWLNFVQVIAQIMPCLERLPVLGILINFPRQQIRLCPSHFELLHFHPLFSRSVNYPYHS
jgi:hypothetical protein